jgi:hypothetical protein
MRRQELILSRRRVSVQKMRKFWKGEADNAHTAQ